MKKSLLAGFLSAVICQASYAQIAFHDISPDTTVNTWNAFSIMPSSVSGNSMTIWWHPSPEVVVETSGDCEILFTTAGSLPAKLNFGDSISPAGNWVAASYDALNSGGTGNWQTAATDKYLGFRFKNSGTNWYYGWLKMSVASGAASFTVKEWAYNSQANKSIKSGQVNAPTGIVSVAIDGKIKMLTTGKALRFDGLEAGTTYKLAITGINGQVIYGADISAAELIDISNIATGMYVVQLHCDGYTRSFRLVIP